MARQHVDARRVSLMAMSEQKKKELHATIRDEVSGRVKQTLL